MSTITVSLAAGRYDRTAPLHDGRVEIDGCTVIPHSLVPEETFFRAFRYAEFDIAELSFSSFLATTSQGICDYVAVPAFPSRSFRHNAIYVREGSDIARPEDLRGKRIGVPEYQLTAHVWVRGFLRDDHGIEATDVEWVTGGVEEPGRPEKIKLNLASQFRVVPAPTGKTLSAMLISGEIDALVCPRAPLAYAPDGAIRRLFVNSAEAAAEYFRRRGIFPIMHVVGIRKSLVAVHPWLPASVFKAFEDARRLAVAALTESAALSVTLPWIIEEVERTRSIMGHDFWTYGVKTNLATIRAFIKHHETQGLSSGLKLEDLFHHTTFDQFKI